MISRLKGYLQELKDVLMYFVAPFAFLAGYTFYLLRKNSRLETELEESKSESEVVKDETLKSSVDSNAALTVDRFEQLREEFRREQNNLPGSSAGGGESNPSSERAN